MDAFFDNATAIVEAEDTAAGCAAMKNGSAKPKFTTMKSVFNSYLGQIYGHPACNQVESLAPRFELGWWWEYDGSCSWEPSEWQAMALLRSTQLNSTQPIVPLRAALVAGRRPIARSIGTRRRPRPPHLPRASCTRYGSARTAA